MKVTRAPFDEHTAALIYRAVRRLFAGQRQRFLHSYVNQQAARIGKADGNDGPLWMWIDDALDPPSDTLRDVADAMVKAHAGAAGHTIKQINLDDPLAISLRSHTEAVNYAAARSAEMIGQVTDTMRKVLRQEITDAVGLNWDVDKLADRLEQTGLFSDQRSEMIARTEVSMAQNQGTLEAGRQARAAGLNVRKVWTLADNPCPLCQEAAAEGDIGLDSPFGDAGDAPPLHPNCMCALDLFVPGEEARKRSEADMDDDDDTAIGGNGDRHAVDVLADLLVEAGSDEGEISRQDAVRWLMHTRHGQALVVRMARHRKRASNRKDFQMTRSEELCSIVKRHDGLDGLCKHIVKKGTSPVSEGELTGMVTAIAKQQFPNLDDARAFTRLFAGPNGEVLRRAMMIAKAAPIPEPRQVGGDDVDPDDPAKALAQLRQMVDELRSHAHHLNESQLWDRVMAQHKSLTKRAFAA
jgi:hypothetical protein